MNNRSSIRGVFDTRLEVLEIKALCFDLHIDYENLTGNTKGEKVMSLLEYCERRDKVEELLRHAVESRPDLKLQLSPPESLKSNNILIDHLDVVIVGDLTVSQKLKLDGVVGGNIIVERSGFVTINGVVNKNLVIQEGGIAMVYGVIERNVINNGGTLEIYGAIQGYVTTKLNGTTYIDESSYVHILLT